MDFKSFDENTVNIFNLTSNLMTKKERLKYTAATMKNNIWESTILKNW